MRKENYSKLSTTERREYQEWLDLCEHIRSQTEIPLHETDGQREARKARLRSSFTEFCKFYFPHYFDRDDDGNVLSDFGWFHRKAAKEIIADKACFAILEWAREHAKSVFANVMMPLYLYATGELEGMVVASANEDKAITLLSDVQAELEANKRYLADYGHKVHHGNWQEGSFSTSDGIGFWAFGRGQSPRGIRKAAKRPNYAVVDDIDDKVIVRNDQRVKEAVAWVMEDLYGALPIKGSRLVVAGNRIHKKSILAHLVGNVEPGDPKRKGITHIIVYAIENPKTHGKADAQHGQPAWKERYTLAQLTAKMEIMGHYSARREYFHEHHEEGLIFKNEWVHWEKALPLAKYDAIVVYTDGSLKETKNSDYKAVVMLGKHGKYVDVVRAWVRQATISAMVKVNYDYWEDAGSGALYYIEENALQPDMMDEFEAEGEARECGQMPIRADKRSKPNKEMRIENLSPLMERGLLRFNEAERQSPDMQVLVQQFLGFPYSHDDGPDAVEGGNHYLQRIVRSSNFKPRMGKYKRTNNR